MSKASGAHTHCAAHRFGDLREKRPLPAKECLSRSWAPRAAAWPIYQYMERPKPLNRAPFLAPGSVVRRWIASDLAVLNLPARTPYTRHPPRWQEPRRLPRKHN